jgi:hypothetical protein
MLSTTELEAHPKPWRRAQRGAHRGREDGPVSFASRSLLLLTQSVSLLL